MKPLPCLVLMLLWFSVPLFAAEPPPSSHVPEQVWIGPTSPFNFQDGDKGEKLVQIGNETFQLITVEKLLADPNPGLTRRNVAIIGELGNYRVKKDDRKWTLSLVENPKAVFSHPEGEFEQNLAGLEGLRTNDFVLVTGVAKPEGNGSTLVVGKMYRIPNELTRLTVEFNEMKKHPDYEAYKSLADSLAQKSAVLNNKGDMNGANKLSDLRAQVVSELLTFRRAMLQGKHLSIEETLEFLDTSIKYAGDDKTAAQEVLKDILKRAPDNKRAAEAVKALLPDWVRFENNVWMPKAEADKLREQAMAKINAARLAAIEQNNQRMNAVAAMSAQRHYAAVKTQALLTDSGFKLPVETEDAWKSLTQVLATSDDYRLVQELLLQSVTQVEPAEWARLIPAVVKNPNEVIRLLGYRLGAFSQDRTTVLWLAQALANDKSDALKEDAVIAICETRTPVTVQCLVRCMELNRSDDRLSQLLVKQAQQLTRRKETALDFWQGYAKDAGKIEIVPE